MRTIGVLLIFTALLFGETVSLNAVADTYTLPAGGCFGTSNTLLIANKSASGHPDERTMILWDLSAYQGRSVNSAALKINAFFQCGSGQGTNTKVYAGTQIWDESWSGTHVSCAVDPVAVYHFVGLGWHQIDITGLVSQWLSGGVDNCGLVLKVAGVYPYTKFHSRETGANGPILVLDLEEQNLDAMTWTGVKFSFNGE
ncbi:MAG: DNRLRE domain-containing protein [Candidatus Sabulitectum sp.]|nr:DNRLRE domain-containing protein [Candidatus Sabulitectum sp.]